MLRYGNVTVEGRTIRYATEGNGPPLLLLHSPPFDYRMWAPVIPYLAGRFRVVAPDLPGFGGSTGVDGDALPDQLVRKLAVFLTAMHMVPCSVAGASLGGGVALGLAARYPERVSALVAVGALGVAWWPTTAQARLARAMRQVPGLLAAGMRIAPSAQARWYLRSALADDQQAGGVLEQVSTLLQSAGGRRSLIRVLRRLDDWSSLKRQLGAIRAPTLLVWGERDRVYGLPVAERLRHAVQGARLVTLPGAGHLLTIERPIELAEMMRNFLLQRTER